MCASAGGLSVDHASAVLVERDASAFESDASVFESSLDGSSVDRREGF